MMKTAFIAILSLTIAIPGFAEVALDYDPLDPADPIRFGGDHFVYRGKTVELGPRAFFIDGRLTEEEASRFPYVFRSINEAAKHLTDGTEAAPMVLHIAPYVYWIDDPDDPAIRLPQDGESPYALKIKCEWLRFHGLSERAENVVLACNRGQTLGSRGNFTLFKITGQGTSSENITFGNYCNVDLVYPLCPSLNRSKRGSAIVQAQLIVCNGDKIVARNTRFISRLNLLPYVGGKRTLFDRCHFESTDDALCTTGVYLNCTFDFHAPRPFVATTGTGAIFLNCDIRSFTRGEQYFTKLNGQLAVIDTRMTGEFVTYVGWKDQPPHETRNYQYNVSLNQQPLLVGQRDAASTIDLAGRPLLDAYRFVVDGEVIYNTYNLLRGDDDWDPMRIKEKVAKAEQALGRTLTMLPTQLLIVPTGEPVDREADNTVVTAIRTRLQVNPVRVTIETGRDEVRLNAKTLRFGNGDYTGRQVVRWAVAAEDRSLVVLKPTEDGSSCMVVPTNTLDATREMVVTAATASGLEAAITLNVAPQKLSAPRFSSKPRLLKGDDSILRVTYELETDFADQSLVTWSRCSDPRGEKAIEVAVSRANAPMLEYPFTAGDIGWYMKATVEPKHGRSDPGPPMVAVFDRPIEPSDVKSSNAALSSDFRNISTRDQPQVIPGFWTMDPAGSLAGARPLPASAPKDAWYHGKGGEGARDWEGLLQSRNARLLYTPVGDRFGDMKLALQVSPFKTAGQGFSLAPLYMDVLIKFDGKSMTGYGLRFIRTTKYHDAVDCVFVKYENGSTREISPPLSTSSFRPTCTITIEVKGHTISAHVESPAEYYRIPNRPEVLPEVKMETEITPNAFGGFGILYFGGSPTLIREIAAEWR